MDLVLYLATSQGLSSALNLSHAEPNYLQKERIYAGTHRVLIGPFMVNAQ